MAYTGKGDMVEFVKNWNLVLSALENPVVIQVDFVGTPASMTFREGEFVISFR